MFTDRDGGLLATPCGAVRYVDNHRDSSTVLFCHGNSGTLDGFAAVMDQLAGDYRTVAFDFIGFGGSSAAADPKTGYSFRGQASVLRSVVNLLKLSDYIIVGHSLGGHVALEALPDLHGAVAAVCVAAPPVGPTSLGQAFRSDPTEGLLFQDQLTDQEAARLASCLADPDLVGEKNHRAALAAVGLAKPGARSNLGRSIGGLELADEVAALEGWDKPAWFVQGTDDPFVDHGYLAHERLQSRRGLTVTLLDACGHSPHLSRPDVVAATITEVRGRTGAAAT